MADELLPYLEPKNPRPGAESASFVQLRVVPFQPAGTPLSVVYMGIELGYLPWAGARPNAGDTVAVVGESGNQVVLPQVRKAHRDPIFADSCRCRCQGGGLIYYLTPIWHTGTLIVLDAAMGAFVARFLLPEALNPEGIAVADDGTLYVVDNRAFYPNLQTDANPNQYDNGKNYFTLLKFALTGSSYDLVALQVLPGADYAEGTFDRPPTVDVGNALGVIDGVLWVTRPGGFWTWDGATLADVTLIPPSDVEAIDPVGPAMRIPQRPAPRDLFVATADGALAQFDPGGTVKALLALPAAVQLTGAMGLCNRLITLHGFGFTRDEDHGTDPETGGGVEET